MEKLKMCIFSDIHYIKNKPDWKINQKLTEYADELVDQMINKINNEIKPDICIHLGDIIQASKNKDEDIKNLKYMWNKLQQIQVPFYTLLGNHELKNMQSNKEVLEILGYNKATFSININDYHLIFLGTDINFEDYTYRTQYISDNDLEWLQDDLKNNNKKTIIFSHFGIAEDRMTGNFWCEKDIELGMIRNRNKIKDLLLFEEKLIAIFVGHQH